jgi:hypothetical protein
MLFSHYNLQKYRTPPRPTIPLILVIQPARIPERPPIHPGKTYLHPQRGKTITGILLQAIIPVYCQPVPPGVLAAPPDLACRRGLVLPWP